MAKKKGLSFAELAAKICGVIDGTNPAAFLNPWPHRFRTIEPAPGAKIIVAEGEGQVITEVPLEHVTNCIVQYMLGCAMPEFFLTAQKAREVARTWAANSKPIPEGDIRLTRWNSEPGYTWHRLPWDQSTGPCPTWDILLDRMTNRDAFQAWVGSLFFEQSDSQQYAYLYGDGGDGKGSINRFLERVFGKAYRSKQPMGGRNGYDKFWTYGLVGARLVAFPDCDDPRFVASGLFKSLTGGDAVAVEAKGGMGFTVRLKAKYLVISNETPDLTMGKADTRRIIYCTVAANNGGIDPTFEAKLWEEGGHFIGKSFSKYLELCPGHTPVPVSLTEIAECVSETEEVFEEVFHKWFALSSLGSVVPGEMMRILNQEFPKKNKPQQDFRRWLARTHGIRKKTTRIDDDCNQKRYNGIITKKQPPRLVSGDVYEEWTT